MSKGTKRARDDHLRGNSGVNEEKWTAITDAELLELFDNMRVGTGAVVVLDTNGNRFTPEAVQSLVTADTAVTGEVGPTSAPMEAGESNS